MDSSSSLTFRAQSVPSAPLRKSSQGFASEMTDAAMPCASMKRSFSATDE